MSEWILLILARVSGIQIKSWGAFLSDRSLTFTHYCELKDRVFRKYNNDNNNRYNDSKWSIILYTIKRSITKQTIVLPIFNAS